MTVSEATERTTSIGNPEAVDAAWNAWYNDEYIPGYRTVPGVIYARRYRVLEGEVRYTTVYEFENDAIPESLAWGHQREHSSPSSGAMRDAMTMAVGRPLSCFMTTPRTSTA